MALRVLVTGGAGFIGSAVCRLFVGEFGATILNLDKLTYAANPESLNPIADDPRYRFCRGDILDRELLAETVATALHPTRSCISPPSRMSIARSMAPANSSAPISRAPTRCWRQPSIIGAACRPSARRGSAFTMSRPTRCSDRSGRTAGSAKTAATSPIPLMPPRKRPRTISCAPGTKPSACRPS